MMRVRKVQGRPTSMPLLLLALAALAALSPGCKKKPAPVASTPDAPGVQSTTAAEPVREESMKPVVEEPMAARSLGAAELNAQGLLKSVYFDFDRYDIRPDQRPTLQANADRLKGNQLSGFRILVEGHCDERGTGEYNLTLGDRRANAIKQYLISLGVPPARLRTISYGEERPANSGHGEESWAKNRRGEFVLEEG